MAGAPIDLAPLQHIAQGGYTPGIIDRLTIEIAGLALPSLVESFIFPTLVPETVDIESGLQARVVTRIYKPPEFNFKLLYVVPHVMGLLTRAPVIQLSSRKTRMGLLKDALEYEDGVQVTGVFEREERVEQTFKAIDKSTVFLSLVHFWQKFGDGAKTWDVAYYRQFPAELRIQGETIVGGAEEKSLIEW